MSWGGDSGRVTNRIVSQIQGYIAEHYAEKLTLTSIANQFYISPYYLSRLFKKTINLSLIEYINGVRIKAAQNMIEKDQRKHFQRGGKDRLYDKRAFPAGVQRCHRAFAPAVPPIFQAGKQTGKIRPKMLQHKTTTPAAANRQPLLFCPLTDKQGRGERCKGISRKGTIMCRNTAESRKLFLFRLHPEY